MQITDPIADMLGDTTCLTGNYICFTNIVQ